MGHSMGGIVAMSLLPSNDISAIITMSTPHTLPPARFDRRIEDMFAASWQAAASSDTPVLSICGGATDTMVPSEYCQLPESSAGYRKTIFTSGMEGVWTGVGHQAMVWCHQVRWTVARAALLVGASRNRDEIANIFDHWFRIKSTPQVGSPAVLKTVPQAVPADQQLHLRSLSHETQAFSFAVTSPAEFVLLASGATVAGLSTLVPSRTQVRVLTCKMGATDCMTVNPQTLRLLPLTRWDKQFPAWREGAGESEGIVALRLRLTAEDVLDDRLIMVEVENGNVDSWISARLQPIRSENRPGQRFLH
jgi:hypothetical protein